MGGLAVGNRSGALAERWWGDEATATDLSSVREPEYLGAQPPRSPKPLVGIRSARGLEAWMLVVPVDAASLLAPVLWAPYAFPALMALSVASIGLLIGRGRYRAKLHLSVLDELPGLVTRGLTATAIVALAFVLRHDAFAAIDFLGLAATSIGLLVAGRFVTTAVILNARRRAVVAHRTVLIGGGALAAEMATLLERYPRYGLSVAGFVDDGDRCDASFVTSHLGAIEDLELVVAANDIEVLLVTEGQFDELQLLDYVRKPDCSECDLLVVPRLHAFHTQTGQSDHIGSVPVMRIRNPSLSGVAWQVKRAFDVVLSAGALLLLSPVLLTCAIAVRLEGGPGIVFHQERIGRDGRTFECLKFRSMKPATSTESATQWNIGTDKRVGPVGKAIRRTSLDELPQLWNILRGDMTLVGPRPERPHFVEKFSAEYTRYAYRHRVPSGLTGLAQVSGLRGDTPISDRARFDNYYIENWSLWLDAKVLLRTVGEVLFAKGR
ncbi:sugar transferase [Actinomycetospora sp. NBRC 106375]|uniref:sugar transferase n=1 Tax=Actinomycetospora sp. NBRC 106375 TaxID=3032207 RepID=UPI002555B7FA|nr:sugar transferase [Actinomycetospora sp. NBRC 106375]